MHPSTRKTNTSETSEKVLYSYLVTESRTVCIADDSQLAIFKYLEQIKKYYFLETIF